MGTDGTETDDVPLSDLAREVCERRRHGRDRTEDGEGGGRVDGGDGDWDDLFESVETPEIDAGTVWETLAADADDADPAARGVGSDAETVEASASGVREHVVPKRAYCQQCPHFSDPPEVACGRDGTAIVEVVDADRFRVRDCPVASDTVESDADLDAR